MGKTENLPERLEKYVEKFEDLILFLLQKSHFFADFDAVRGAEREINHGNRFFAKGGEKSKTIFDFFTLCWRNEVFHFSLGNWAILGPRMWLVPYGFGRRFPLVGNVEQR